MPRSGFGGVSEMIVVDPVRVFILNGRCLLVKEDIL